MPPLDTAPDPREAVLRRAILKVHWRLLPFLGACYIAAYLDRVNVGFAALTMNADLGIGPEMYGFAAGIFFLGYCLFEVPSNVLLERFGARVWIGRIMITWGLISAAMAFVPDVSTFVVLRFLLGVAEAGFFPGIIFYLTLWIPASDRARVVSMFMAAIPVSNIIGAPVSGWILDGMDGVQGLRGWQWVFILEAMPSIALGLAAFFYLTDKPGNADWLEPEERRVLASTIAAEAAAREASRKFTLLEALTDKRILGLSIVCLGLGVALYGLGFWLPQIVKELGLGNTATGLVAAAPYVAGAAAMILWGRRSDATGERVWHVAGPSLACGVAMIAAAGTTSPLLALAAFAAAIICTLVALPVFWTLPTAMLTGVAAAAGIALINSVGNSGGFIGPYLIGWLKEQGHSSAVAVSSLAGFMFLTGLLVLAIGHDRHLERRVRPDDPVPEH